MTLSRRSGILAIDGGGTRCRLAYSDGESLVSVESGSANVSTDFDGAVSAIEAGLHLLAERLSKPVSHLVSYPVFAGLAGVTGPSIAARLRSALPFKTVKIDDDRPSAVRGALGKNDGVLAHAGTGSFYAAQLGGNLRLSGGWGPILGDEASAQWVGRAALREALESADGRQPSSPLSEHLMSKFDGTAGIVSFAGKARPTDFGNLAVLVTDYAERGDVLAHRVMQQGADEIARSLTALGWTLSQAICVTGGIGPNYVTYLPEGMQDCVVEPAGTPLDGAISLAHDFAREVCP